MKKTLVLVAALALGLQMMAQQTGKPHHERKHREVMELVDDLSAAQKRKVEAISKESRERMSTLRAQQKAVHDSIATFMNAEGDQSATLYPLFEREAALQTAVSKEMYATKLRIDEVLTREQRNNLRQALHKEKHRK